MCSSDLLLLALQKAKHVCDWHTPTLNQKALAYFIDDGSFTRHIRKVSALYRDRREILVDTLERDFSDHLELIPSSTGLHLATLARSASVEQISAIARRAGSVGVAVQRLSSFAASELAQAGLVFGYGAIPASQIEKGLRLLRQCFDG